MQCFLLLQLLLLTCITSKQRPVTASLFHYYWCLFLFSQIMDRIKHLPAFSSMNLKSNLLQVFIYSFFPFLYSPSTKAFSIIYIHSSFSPFHSQQPCETGGVTEPRTPKKLHGWTGIGTWIFQNFHQEEWQWQQVGEATYMVDCSARTCPHSYATICKQHGLNHCINGGLGLAQPGGSPDGHKALSQPRWLNTTIGCQLDYTALD